MVFATFVGYSCSLYQSPWKDDWFSILKPGAFLYLGTCIQKTEKKREQEVIGGDGWKLENWRRKLVKHTYVPKQIRNNMESEEQTWVGMMCVCEECGK